MDKKKEESPIQKWRNNLKPGDLIWITQGDYLYPGVFKTFLPGISYDGLRMHYYPLPVLIHNRSWYIKNMEEWEAGKSKPHIHYINSRAADRIVPMSVDMLNDDMKDYYKRLKQLIR